MLTYKAIGIELSKPEMSIGKAMPYLARQRLYSALKRYFLPNNGNSGTDD